MTLPSRRASTPPRCRSTAHHPRVRRAVTNIDHVGGGERVLSGRPVALSGVSTALSPARRGYETRRTGRRSRSPSWTSASPWSWSGRLGSGKQKGERRRAASARRQATHCQTYARGTSSCPCTNSLRCAEACQCRSANKISTAGPQAAAQGLGHSHQGTAGAGAPSLPPDPCASSETASLSLHFYPTAAPSARVDREGVETGRGRAAVTTP